MKVLLVEDDPKISSFVKIGLESNDCQVDIAFDGVIGEKLALSKNHDVIILDVVIPGISGFELCRSIREKGIQTPVMMLTSLDTLDDKLTGFDAGADDYLVKPFSFQELFARLKALNRRKAETDISPVLKCTDLELDTNTRKVFRNGQEINLTATEYKILELLLGNRDKVFERVVIAEKIWGFSFNSGTNVIDVHINSLRKKIDRDFSPKLIHTRKGFGYVLSEEPQE
ncbi:MAG TPA: response regulator transcription factor [Bacteroidales bacterium]|nr:response regulator transcription factor [Bacteroidales bacterium]